MCKSRARSHTRTTTTLLSSDRGVRSLALSSSYVFLILITRGVRDAVGRREKCDKNDLLRYRVFAGV